MNLIEFTQGGVVTRGHGSMDIFVSYRDKAASKDLPLHEAIKDPGLNVSEPAGIVETVPSSRGAGAKLWTKRRVDFPNGSYVRFTIRRTVGGAVGAFSHGMHNLIISPRESAPLQEIRIALPTDDRANISALYIIGRFDFLMPGEIKKLKLDKGTGGTNDVATYDLAALSEFITLRVMEKAIKPRVKTHVVTNKVTGTSVARIRRPRRINLPAG